MPTKQVTIQGIMTWEDSGDHIWGGGNVPLPTPPIHIPPTPPGIWGPNDPRPSNPIANVPGISNPNPPGWGMRPEHPIYYPDHIWGGGNVPLPTPPIHIPGLPVYIWGGGNVPLPTPPIANAPGTPGYQPPTNLPPGGTPIPPAVGVPIDGKLVFVPGYGWMFIPDGAGGSGEDRPHPEHPIVKPDEEER